MKKNLNVLLAIINAYEESDGFSNFSGTELNRTFGYATDTLAESLKITQQIEQIVIWGTQKEILLSQLIE